MAEKIEFKYINPELYRHPGEREARARLDKLPGFHTALAMMSEGVGAKAERQAVIASMTRVGKGVYPVLNDMWNDTQNLFGINGIPLHIAFDYPQPWTVRGGDENPMLIIDSKWLDILPEKEMSALLAMQAGVIRLKNANWLAYADFLRWLSDFSGIAAAPMAMVAWGMENWRRYAYFSADRAAALSSGDPEAVASLLNRMAGAASRAWGGVAEPDQLRIQGIEALSHEQDKSSSLWRRFSIAMNRQNRIGLIRRLDLLDWFATGNPARIMTGEMTVPEGEKVNVGAAGGDNANMADPGLAYWGEFATFRDDYDKDDCDEGKGKWGPMSDIMNVAEKGWTSFLKAGETFWDSFRGK